MSELDNESLIENIDYEVEDASVIPVPVDPTLSNAGEAADAKATGDAIAAVAGAVNVNGKTPVSGVITVYGTDIKVNSEEGAETLTAALQEVGGRDASDITFDADEGNTIKQAVDAVNAKTAANILYQSGEEDTIYSVVDNVIDTLETGITDAEIDDIFDTVFGED